MRVSLLLWGKDKSESWMVLHHTGRHSVPSTLYIFIYWILFPLLWSGSYYHPYFIDGETKGQRSWATCRISQQVCCCGLGVQGSVVWRSAHMRCQGAFPGSFPGGREGSGAWQKSGCDAVPAEALVNPMGSSGAGLALQFSGAGMSGGGRSRAGFSFVQIVPGKGLWPWVKPLSSLL